MSFFSFLLLGEERETGKTCGGNLVVTVFSSANVGGANKGNRWLSQMESRSKMK